MMIETLAEFGIEIAATLFDYAHWRIRHLAEHPPWKKRASGQHQHGASGGHSPGKAHRGRTRRACGQSEGVARDGKLTKDEISLLAVSL